MMLPVAGCRERIATGTSLISAPPGIISSVLGEVLVQENGSDTWAEATTGMKLEVGDHFKTEDDGYALLVFFEASVMEVLANSEIAIAELATVADTGSTIVRLRQSIGNTINRVERLIDPASRYEVETPAGSLMVRGTVFTVQVRSDGYTVVVCEEGNVWFSAGGVAVLLGEQMESSAPPGGTPSFPSLSTGPTPTPPPSPGPTPTPTVTPTPTLTPVSTCVAGVTFSAHPGDYALVEASGTCDRETVRHGETLSINFQLEYVGPVGPILGRPILFISDPDLHVIRAWSIAEDGSLHPNGPTIGPYTICKGSRFAFDIVWDLTDGFGRYVPPAEYIIAATIESPYSDKSGRFHLLDCTSQSYIHVTVEE